MKEENDHIIKKSFRRTRLKAPNRILINVMSEVKEEIVTSSKVEKGVLLGTSALGIFVVVLLGIFLCIRKYEFSIPNYSIDIFNFLEENSFWIFCVIFAAWSYILLTKVLRRIFYR